MDQRITNLAYNLIHHSVRLQSGEKLLIELTDQGHPLAKALMEEAYQVGGQPFIWVKDQSLLRSFLNNASQDQVALMGQWEASFYLSGGNKAC